jgi:hypothetical protein
MGTRRVVVSTTVIYVIAVLVIIAAFFLLHGGLWIREMMHGGRSAGMVHLNWLQIIIGLGLGFLAGWFAAKRRW